ncbi:MAG: hypothetical protein Q9164_005280 [Protoblastenia rupestris]
MLMLSLTFFQVMPEFLDFLFPLGERVLAQDFYCSGFKQQTRLAGIADGLRIPERGWSGCNLQICYSLKSVERSPTQTDWPWSIRHCAAHHAFDVENVRSSWIIVKGDQLMETRVKSATISRGPPEFSSFGTVDSAFAAALATHLILCDWSVEGWRWYIDFLVDTFEELTQDTISANVDVPTSPLQNGDLFSLGPPTGTQATNQTQRSQMSSLPRQLRSHRQRTDTMGTITEKEPTYPQSLYTNPKSGKKQPLPPGKTMSNLQESKRTPIQYDMYGQQQFSFQDLQDIQDIEERACEAVLVLKLNQSVIRQLADFYRSIFDNKELPEVIIKNCRVAMVRFDRRVHGLEKDMNSQTLRIETLMRLIGDRKTLLYGLLDFQNTQASKTLALQSRKSTKNMEVMTTDMSEIARKTKTETVSMKIITLVTLFFLPGTFISVGRLFLFYLVSQYSQRPSQAQLYCSGVKSAGALSSMRPCSHLVENCPLTNDILSIQTLMSTDIVHWKDGRRDFQSGALQIYLAVSLPFMVVTIGVWKAFQWQEKRNERRHNEKTQASLA